MLRITGPFVCGIHRRSVVSPHKGPTPPKRKYEIVITICTDENFIKTTFPFQWMRKAFPSHDVIIVRYEVIKSRCFVKYSAFVIPRSDVSPTALPMRDVIMSAIASKITGFPIVYSTVCSGEDHRPPVNSPHKGPVTRKRFSFDDVITVY